VLAAAAAGMIGFTGFTLVMPFLPLYIAELGVTDVKEIAMWTGLTLGATPTVTAISAPLWGRVGDRYGSKILVIRSLIAFILTKAGMAFVTAPWQLFALRALLGLFAGYGALTISMAAESAPRDRMAQAIGMVQTGHRLGPAVGPVIGGLLAPIVGLRRAFLFAAAFYVVALIAIAVSGQVQKSAGDWNEWETITPEGEEFTVSMPKNPTTETTKFAYHKMELNARSYLATQANGPVFAIVSLSGIKASPGADFARFNSYVDAFKDYFPPKVRTRDTAITKLTLVSSRPFHGHTGRSYKLAVGELNGVAHAFATRKRFYVIISLNTKDQAAAEKKAP